MLWESPAVAEAAMKSGVARRKIDIDEYREILIARQGLERQTRNNLINKAKAGPNKRIVFGEGEESKIIRAAAQIHEENIAEPILLGNPERIRATINDLGLDFEPQIIRPHTEGGNYGHYRDELVRLRQRKGMNPTRARTLLRSRTNFGLMMVKMGDADAFVSGIVHEYPDIIRPALQMFHTRPGATRASGVYLVIVKGQVYLFTDATVNIDPDAETLAEIAILAADYAKTLDIDPKVAMLSFSNFGGTPHALSAKVQHAVDIVREKRPDLVVDGEMQADTAVVTEIVDERYPFSMVKDANVLVFPDLGSANIAYKLLDRLTKAEVIGPILLGMGAPVQVLQAGDDVENIVAMTAVASLDAQSRG
jgi:malate dehydrogenase (oxaloacetate-decarboxylating)(NADP+)